MAKWTEEMEEQLIALVEERPPLYNITLQGYSNRNRKDQLWREIESELHLSGKEVRRKWDNLRTTYNRFKKTAPRTTRQQWTLDRMQFIEPHTKRKGNTSNLNRRELCEAGAPEGASMVTDSSLEGSGSTLPEEPELDIPLAGSPIAESAICAFLGNSQPPAFLDTRDKGEFSSRIMFKWTEEMEEQLIALVEERPPLYNITLQGYSNRNRKDQLWREIESELHLSGKEVRRKWDNLRTTYNRFKKTAPLGSSGAPRTTRQQWTLNRMQFIEPHTKRKESTSNLPRKELCDAGAPEGASMVTDSSSEGNGSTLPEEPELDIPLAGSPTICEGTLPGVLECSLTSGGTDQGQRPPAKRKKKRWDGAVNEEVVLMQTIGKTLERMATGAPRQEEHNDYISVCCKRIEHRLRMLPQHQLAQFEYEMDCLLYRFSQNQIQETD
ncbi:uncharacterized protein LOC132466381 [Gadus macrocephalus]|uniref:uncharacterized protein LOC132466381 n=1 Tax=Gadus macrocephalus TaxID=80720 RepID=UPI0028CB7A9A|nr:uncharacterized protein LOC132466381 [Gadus macrocephalus]XP_059919574.1 uncharacterized protein LOC132466381 [Gadus macrocephalus]